MGHFYVTILNIKQTVNYLLSFKTFKDVVLISENNKLSYLHT